MASDLAIQARQNFIEKINSTPALKESFKHGVSELQRELGYTDAPVLERLLIDDIVLCWMRMYLTEYYYTAITHDSVTITMGKFWEKRLTEAQRRYTRACESLARIRKLARSTPALQVNIAAPGSRQLNVVGDLNPKGPATVHPMTKK